MVAVLSACAVMGFVKSMDVEGEYRIDDGRLVRGGASKRAVANHYLANSGLPTPKPKAGGAKAAKAGGASEPAAEDTPERRAARAEAEHRAAERQAAEEQAASAGDDYGLLVPLLYAPLVPLMRIGLRNRVPPERLTQATLGIIAVALAHAGSYMFTDSSVALRK